MGQDVFVDVAYRGLELGRRLKLREVGPRTAYLEHGMPMPVGARLVIRTDGGLSIPVVVIRVHEQVAGAEMPPGMRVTTEVLDAAAAGWWRGLVTREDPVIPEVELPPPVARSATSTVPPADESQPLEAHDTAVMDAVELVAAAEPAAGRAGGNGAGQGDLGAALASGRTMVMSATEIKDITDTAAGGGEADDDSASHDARAGGPDAVGTDPGTGSNGDELQGDRGHGNRRRRRR